MWTPEHRRAVTRRGLRYESDLTDAEWVMVAALIQPAKRSGRPRTVNVREVLNAILHVLWTGCQLGLAAFGCGRPPLEAVPSLAGRTCAAAPDLAAAGLIEFDAERTAWTSTR